MEVVRRAVRARSHAYADPSLRHFHATAQGHVYFLGEFRGEREVVRADQVALDIRWQAPDRALQTIVGRRHEARWPHRIRYHIDHLSLILDNFGDRIRLGEGEEVWNALHPAAPGATAVYEYRLADSLEIRVRDRTAQVYRLDVRPTHPDRPGVVGSMFVDRASGAIARLRLTFTGAAYRDPQLERITLDLRSALWEGRYWLPAEQEVEIRRSLAWLAFPIESVIRTRITVLDYDLDSPPSFPLGPGQRVASLPPVALEAFDGWREPLYGGPLEPGDRSDRDLERAVREARALVKPSALLGSERLRLSLPRASDGLRARRAEGVLVGGGGAWAIDDATELSFWGGYPTASGRPEARISLERIGGGQTVSVQLGLRDLADAGYFAAASGVVQTVALALDGEDYSDPFFEDGGRIAVAREAPGARIEIGLSARRQRRASLAVETVLATRTFRPVRPIDEGELVALDIGAELEFARALGTRWTLAASGEIATAGVGTWGYRRAVLTVSGERAGLGSGWAWRADATLGTAGGNVPAQRLFLLGGRGTLPGHAFRRWGGDRVALFRVEISRSVLAPWLRVRGLGGTGRTGLGHAGEAAAARFGVSKTPAWQGFVGVGAGLLWDLIRIDAVRGVGSGAPFGGEAPGGSRGWEVLFSIHPLLWNVL